MTTTPATIQGFLQNLPDHVKVAKTASPRVLKVLVRHRDRDEIVLDAHQWGLHTTLHRFYTRRTLLIVSAR
jgi:hypothetical protein